ncbi:hypothetical protein LJC72_07155 [Bacteroides sp. OttesenSCG-928-D19]|nr:hypothetical protein [Bacteroides sp. OttesenSCG-928-N06]MDL2305101.1 hypothetical protein [Bacteroides sp. OttesenSCG-928-D19]
MKEKKKYTYISKASAVLCAVFMCFGLFSCSSEAEDNWQTTNEERPIEFDFQLPDDGPATRTKTTFVNGDKIYVTAKVTLANSSEKVKTSILKHDGTKFNPDPADNRLMWPADAVKAHFTAYYLPATHNTAPTEGSPLTIPLAGLSETGTNDDLLLANQDVVNLNGIVLLRFAHTTTKLRFHGLLPAAKEIKLSSNKALNTGIEVSYSADKGYTHEFITDGTNEYSVVKAVGTDDGTGAYTRSVFFIDVTSEWKDATFMLYQYTNAGDTEPIKTTPLTEKNINLYTMQKGRAYYISFYGEPNNDLVAEEDKWYNKGAPKVFETTDQIKAYFAGEGKNGLTQDLDFNNLLLDDGVINFPATRGINFTGDIFNGNNFAIRNVYVKNGLFNNIPAGATVTNLRLENVKVIGEDGDAAGLLAPSNSGTIDNVRISGNNNLGTKNVQYVGALVGENEGTIRKVQVSGALTVEAYMYNTTAFKVFAVGGLVGYNNGGISDSEINAGGLLKVGGEYTMGDIAIGGMIGYHVQAKTVTGCSTYVRVDATQLTARNSYVGGFCGVNRGKMEKSEAAGEVKGALFTMRSATGGFLGYTTSLTEKTNVATVNGCGATGNVYESGGAKATYPDPDVYTGGFCGFSEIDLKNVYAVGNITSAGNIGTEQKIGALVGIISAEKTIFNSFSMTREGATDLTFSGDGECKIQNAHYRKKMLTEQGEVDNSINATVTRLNNAVSSANGYWEWNSSSTIYEGAPYLVKQ